MTDKLRRIALGKPVIAAAGLLALYLLCGFFALPAVLKWQLEKQVPETLGHRISVNEVRFNPLAFRLEVRDLALSDADGRQMLGFKRLLVDFELRSAIDRTWTFAQLTLKAPLLRFELEPNGRHNFSDLLDRLRRDEPEESASLPRLVVKRVALTDGGIEFSDRLLAEPLVARIDPLQIGIDNLSTLPAHTARYGISARTAAGETLEAAGEMALNPVAAKGRLALGGIRATTLARSLARLLKLGPSAGTIAFTGNFDVALDGSGSISGGAHQANLGAASLSLSAPGASEPLIAIGTLALQQGRVDLAAREASFDRLHVANGKVAASLDGQGVLDWSRLARAAAAAPTQIAAVAAPAAPRPWRVSLTRADAENITVGFSDASGGRSAAIAALGLELSASAEFGGAGTRIELAKPKLSIEGAKLANGADAVDLPAAAIAADGIAIAAADHRLEFALTEPRVVAPDGVSARLSDAAIGVRGITVAADRAAMNSAGSSVGATLDDARIALTAVSISGAAQRTQLGSIAVEGKHLALNADAERFNIDVAKLRGALADLALNQAADGIKLGTGQVTADKISVARASGRIRVSGNAAAASASVVSAWQSADRIALQSASFETRAISAAAGGAAPAAPGAEVRLEDAALRLASVEIVARGAASEIIHVPAARFGAGSLTLALPDGPADATGEGLSARLSDAVVRSPVDATEVLRLGSATLSGGALRLKDRVASADKLAFAGGHAAVWLNQRGEFNLLSLFSGTDADTAMKSPPAAAPAPAWRLALKAAELGDFSLALEDRRASPAFAVGFQSIRARVAALDTGSAAPMRVELQARIASGGQIEAKGEVRADDGRSDLSVNLSGVALAPLQTYLSEFAELRLASGTASTAGRLRYGDTAGAKAQLAYAGSMSIDRLLLEEIEPKRPFLAWDSIASRDVALTLQPNRATIGELRIDRPSGRLIIAADRTLNLSDVLKPRKEHASAPGAGDGRSTGPDSAPAQDEAFPVSVARVRISGGALKFADLSLRPQFATRMHELNGVISGLSTDAGRSAKLQLDAKVDKHGSAKIRGRISALHPGKQTEIDVAFRNLEMASLSPYVAKFAGYRIAGGRLALDLQYRVNDDKLLGENKIVLKQVSLGEKVDSPDALDVPLELALAILKDAEGVIDIELPVSGNLDDPKFDYGAVIAKAFGNILGGIASAPFKALGALFGAGAKELDSIDFEPGSDVIAPPEQYKLEAVARALNERPGLVLVVPPTYAEAEDAPALKSLAVHSDIVRRMGLDLAPGEDPGPIDTASPEVQRAIEGAFRLHYAPEVLAALKQRALEAAAPAAIPVQPSPTQSPRLPPEFYDSLIERMIAQQPVSAPVLAGLALRRGEAIVRELTTVGGLPPARVVLGEARAATAADGEAVTLRLALEVAK